MRATLFVLLLCAGCSAGAVEAASDAGDTVDGTGVEDAVSSGTDAASSVADGGTGIADSSADAPETLCVLWVDDAGVSHGCGSGDNGPGDRDDGGGAAKPPPSDASPDAADLPMGASCLDNAQCASDICFYYQVRGTFCTQRCWTNSNCPPPANGCNGMGVCRFGDGG
jgi:hypothetical protein